MSATFTECSTAVPTERSTSLFPVFSIYCFTVILHSSITALSYKWPRVNAISRPPQVNLHG